MCHRTYYPEELTMIKDLKYSFSGPGANVKFRAYYSAALTSLPDEEFEARKEFWIRLAEFFAQPPLYTELYLPGLYTSPKLAKRLEAEHVYLIDRLRVAESDYVVLDLAVPSFGVGQELEIATALGVPCVPMYQDDHAKGGPDILRAVGRKITRMAVGSRDLVRTAAGDDLRKHPFGMMPYVDESHLREQLLTYVPPLLRVLEGLKWPRRSETFAKRLRRLRETGPEPWTLEELSHASGLTVDLLRLFEIDLDALRAMLANRTDYEIEVREGRMPMAETIGLQEAHFDRFTNPSVGAVYCLADSLDVAISDLIEAPDSEAWRFARLRDRARDIDRFSGELGVDMGEKREIRRRLLGDWYREIVNADSEPMAAQRARITKDEFVATLQRIRTR